MNLSDPLGEPSPLMTVAEAQVFDALRTSMPLTEADRPRAEAVAWVQAMAQAGLLTSPPPPNVSGKPTAGRERTGAFEHGRAVQARLLTPVAPLRGDQIEHQPTRASRRAISLRTDAGFDCISIGLASLPADT